MIRPVHLLSALTLTTAALAAVSQPARPADPPSPGDRMLTDYFRHETTSLAERCLADIKSLDDWKAKRGEYRRQLQEMLGLWPMPERTDLKPVITGRLEHDEFTVEKLHFQASPQLYVTANLYLPKKRATSVLPDLSSVSASRQRACPDPPESALLRDAAAIRAPAILYVCGHSKQSTNGVSFGNKTGYQHHGAWFARNGYVCLVIDSLQLGEIEGLHHGTHHLNQWWWNARGYTPAGVEAWFGIRALDYLCSRPEVDKERLGMTGRSGGGSYSWTVAALDDRVKVVAPIAGITDLQNQVVDGCVAGHCDCMFFVNTYRWDFPQVAALIAPRPLLLGNSDKDGIFPLDGVVRLHEKVRRIYRLYGETNTLGLLITDGPHADTQDLQVPVFRWFNRWLKGEQPLVEMAAKKLFGPSQLKVFDTLPADELNTKIQESFMPVAKPVDTASQPRNTVLATLREKCFRGWPDESLLGKAEPVAHGSTDGLRVRYYFVIAQPEVELLLTVVQHPKIRRPDVVRLVILDEQSWTNWPAEVLWNSDACHDPATPEMLVKRRQMWLSLATELRSNKTAVAFFAPRGIGCNWTGSEKKLTLIRRRFMLLGQTLDGMRAWDIRCAARALQTLPEFKTTLLCVQASGSMGVNTLYATLFEPAIMRAELTGLPASLRDGPDYLNVLKVLDLPDAMALAGARVSVR